MPYSPGGTGVHTGTQHVGTLCSAIGKATSHGLYYTRPLAILYLLPLSELLNEYAKGMLHVAAGDEALVATLVRFGKRERDIHEPNFPQAARDTCKACGSFCSAARGEASFQSKWACQVVFSGTGLGPNFRRR